MQQIRIVDDATPVAGTDRMRLRLSDHPDQTWIAWFRQFAAATAEGKSLEVRVEGHALVFTCPERKELTELTERRRLIGSLVDQVNSQETSA
jgi:hypothetical protein